MESLIRNNICIKSNTNTVCTTPFFYLKVCKLFVKFYSVDIQLYSATHPSPKAAPPSLKMKYPIGNEYSVCSYQRSGQSPVPHTPPSSSKRVIISALYQFLCTILFRWNIATCHPQNIGRLFPFSNKQNIILEINIDCFF